MPVTCSDPDFSINSRFNGEGIIAETGGNAKGPCGTDLDRVSIVSKARGIGAANSAACDSNSVIAPTSLHHITSTGGGDGVIASIAVKTVGSRAAINGVVAVAANEDVIAGQSGDGVVTAIAIN